APLITDFGLAKRLESAEPGPTRTEAMLGTPSYMAPEQAANSRGVGPAADVYSLGAILYECLTGQPPFRGESALDTLEQVRTLPPVRPSRLRPRLPRDLGSICLKCLEKEPGRRYTSAAELAEDLNRFLAGVATKARPVGWPARGWRWARRHPLSAALTAA